MGAGVCVCVCAHGCVCLCVCVIKGEKNQDLHQFVVCFSTFFASNHNFHGSVIITVEVGEITKACER